MEYVTLNNGVKMPKLGYGVYQTPPEETEACVSEASAPATAALIRPRPTAMKKG